MSVVHTYYSMSRKSLMRKSADDLAVLLANMQGRIATADEIVAARKMWKSNLVDRVMEIHDALPPRIED